MPITQDRFLKVLKAGNAWKQAYEGARAQIHALILDYESSKITKEELAQQLWSTFIQNTPDMETVVPLMVESAVFTGSRQKFNAREKARQRSKRAQKAAGTYRPQLQSQTYKRPTAELSLAEIMNAPQTSEDVARIRREMQAELEQSSTSAAGSKLAQLLASSSLPEAEIPNIPIEQTLRPISDIQPPAVNGDELDGDFEL